MRSEATDEPLCFFCFNFGGKCAGCHEVLYPALGTPSAADDAPLCPSCCLLLNAAVCGGCAGPRELRDPSSVADGVAYCASCVAEYEAGDWDDGSGDADVGGAASSGTGLGGAGDGMGDADMGGAASSGASSVAAATPAAVCAACR